MYKYSEECNCFWCWFMKTSSLLVCIWFWMDGLFLNYVVCLVSSIALVNSAGLLLLVAWLFGSHLQHTTLAYCCSSNTMKGESSNKVAKSNSGTTCCQFISTNSTKVTNYFKFCGCGHCCIEPSWSRVVVDSDLHFKLCGNVLCG